MIVCIAEKPSVAQEIAKILGANSKKDGYIEGNGYQVTWTFGHLCNLKMPGDYKSEWKYWNLNNLPIIPDEYGIKLIEDVRIKKQFKIIKQLFKSAERIVNCGDAGQEGELIQRWVLQLSGARCPVDRLWISSLTEESIREGFRNLRPQSDYDTLFKAGLARSEGDWLLGINCSQLFTMRYGNNHTLSIGRVQTPTLAMIVDRDKEIENFKPQPYWVLATKYRNTLFTYNVNQGKIAEKYKGIELLNSIKGYPFVIKDIQNKQGREQAPQLYDLTSLQVDCNKKFGFSAETTLNSIQGLYDKKLTTYPRVDTKYLPDDVYPKIHGIMVKLVGYEQFVSPFVNGNAIPMPKRVFNNSKVTDHHAIIPTGDTSNLSGIGNYERKVYDLIVKRFIAAFYPDCQYNQTTVFGETNGVVFKATGRTITNEGWRYVYGKPVKEEEDDEQTNEGILPVFTVGESGAHQPTLTEKMTTPPKHYTEATLLQAMETAGKFVDDEELRDAMKENGIGRPSSRAAIIEKIIKMGYVVRDKKNLISTRTGRDLISIINVRMLKSPELTGQWEKKLRDIEKGSFTLDSFMSELQSQLVAIINDVKNDNSGQQVTMGTTTSAKPKSSYSKSSSTVSSKRNRKTATKSSGPKLVYSDKPVKDGDKCPICGKGIVRKSQYGFFCTEYKVSGCRLTYKG